jgi:hypothetical protein
MSKIPPLFTLPNALITAFLSEWLDMSSIGKLDTAISAKKHRPPFLLCLQDMRSSGVVEMTECWWKWVSIRQVYIESTRLVGGTVRSVFTIPSLRNVHVQQFVDEDLSYLVRNCPAITSLEMTISHDEAGTEAATVTETGLKYISDYCQTLERFSYRRQAGEQPAEYTVQTAAALMGILRQCPNLTEVSLTGDVMNGVDLDELCPFGHLIRELNMPLPDETDSASAFQSLANLFGACVNLRVLELYTNGFVPADGSMAIPAQSFPSLQNLTLVGFTDDAALRSVLDGIVLNCKHFSTLRLLWCKLSESSASLRCIAGMEGLRDLSLENCTDLTDAGIASLATLRLTRLELTEWERVSRLTAASLQSFVVGANICQTLESLSINLLDTHRAIDAAKVAAALDSCHKLKERNVKWGTVSMS